MLPNTDVHQAGCDVEDTKQKEPRIESRTTCHRDFKVSMGWLKELVVMPQNIRVLSEEVPLDPTSGIV